MYFACNMPHYSPYELVNPAKMAAVAGFLPSYLDFSDRLLAHLFFDLAFAARFNTSYNRNVL